MLTFLRKIRKSFIDSGSSQKYLLYAIGEIALVVIGILIALQINNWNEQKKKVNKERNALSEILSDLEVNSSSLEDNLYHEQNNILQAIESLNVVLLSLENASGYHDSLSIHFRNVYNYPYVELKVSGYESLSSMGMDLVADQHVRSEIGKYYTYVVPIAGTALRELRDDFYKYMIGHMQEKFVAKSVNNKMTLLEPRNFSELKNDIQYRQSLIMYLDLFEYYKVETLKVLVETKQLQMKIEKMYN